MTILEKEHDAIEMLRRKYSSEGYEVLIEDRGFAIESYIPDLVLRKGDQITLVEVKTRKTPNIVKQMDRLKRRIEENSSYRFLIYYLEDLRIPDGPKQQSSDQILAATKEAASAAEQGNTKSAFLLCWAAFEATARFVFVEAFRRPQSPGRLVTILAEEGYLLPSEAHELRRLISKRNSLIHGDLEVQIDERDVDLLISIVQGLLIDTPLPD